MTLNIRTVCASILNKNVDYISGHRYDPKYKDFLYINTELKRWSYFGRVIYFQAVRSRNKGVVQREVKYRDGRYVVVDQTLERNYRQKAFLWKLRESTSAARGCSQLSSRGWKRRIPEIKTWRLELSPVEHWRHYMHSSCAAGVCQIQNKRYIYYILGFDPPKGAFLYRGTGTDVITAIIPVTAIPVRLRVTTFTP